MERLNLHIAFTSESAYKDRIGLPAEELAPRATRFADEPPSISIDIRSRSSSPILYTCLRITPMTMGTVKWFNETKGYGFIQPDNGGPDVFVHVSAVEQAGMRGLTEGQKISFEIVADRRTGKSSAGMLKTA